MDYVGRLKKKEENDNINAYLLIIFVFFPYDIAKYIQAG